MKPKYAYCVAKESTKLAAKDFKAFLAEAWDMLWFFSDAIVFLVFVFGVIAAVMLYSTALVFYTQITATITAIVLGILVIGLGLYAAYKYFGGLFHRAMDNCVERYEAKKA